MAAHHTPVSMNRPDPGVKYGDQELIVKSLRPEKAIMADSVFLSVQICIWHFQMEVQKAAGSLYNAFSACCT